MNKLLLAVAFICFLSLSLATSGNYTVELQITGLQNQNTTGNSSNYTVDTIFPYSPQAANGSNYTATVGIEILGWYFPPVTVLPPTNWSLLAAFLGMSKAQQTITSIYTSITSPVLGGFSLTMVVSLILLLLGLAFLLIYTLKYWGTKK